jgi:UDP-glucose 6-dehydrogenase
MKQWKIKAIQETDITTYARKLQSILNKMEIENFDFTVEGPGVNLITINGITKFMALVTGSRDITGSRDLEEMSFPVPPEKETDDENLIEDGEFL